MEQEKIIEKLVLVCLDTAKAMLEEYETVIPFGIRSFTDNDDMKMNCPGDKKPDGDFNEQIDKVIEELKAFVSNENIFATALVTELEADNQKGIGLQVETQESSVLFVYPFHLDDEKEGKGEWLIEEPFQAGHLLKTVYERH